MPVFCACNCELHVLFCSEQINNEKCVRASVRKREKLGGGRWTVNSQNMDDDNAFSVSDVKAENCPENFIFFPEYLLEKISLFVTYLRNDPRIIFPHQLIQYK